MKPTKRLTADEKVNRTPERVKEILDTEGARPKIQIIKAYGLYRVGEVLQLTAGRREYLVSQGFAKPVK